MIGIDVRVDGDRQLREKLVGLERRLRNLKPVLEVVAELLERHVGRVFSSQGASIGKPWRPLKPRTVRARQRRWGYYRRAPTMGASASGPILTWSGRARRSLKRGGTGHLRQITRDSLTWGSRVRYLRYHDSRRPRRKLPRRPILEFRDQVQRREILVRPILFWVQGMPLGGIRALSRARARV